MQDGDGLPGTTSLCGLVRMAGGLLSLACWSGLGGGIPCMPLVARWLLVRRRSTPWTATGIPCRAWVRLQYAVGRRGLHLHNLY